MIRSRLRSRSNGGGASGPSYVGPVDAYTTGLTVAYSVARRLLSSYTGPLLRLRRDSDDDELDIGYDGDGLLDTATAASFIGGANGFGVTLYDQSGGGLDLTQATAASQPAFHAAGFQSGPTLDFDGVNDYLRRSSGVSFGAFSIFVAGKWNKNGDGLLYEHSDNTNGGNGAILNAGVGTSCIYTTRTPAKNDRTDTGGRMADNTSRLVVHRSNGTNATHLLRSNGADRTMSNGGNTEDVGTASVSTSFNLHARSGGTAPIPGQTSELIGYSAYLTGGDLTGVEAAINDQYGVY